MTQNCLTNDADYKSNWRLNPSYGLNKYVVIYIVQFKLTYKSARWFGFCKPTIEWCNTPRPSMVDRHYITKPIQCYGTSTAQSIDFGLIDPDIVGFSKFVEKHKTIEQYLINALQEHADLLNEIEKRRKIAKAIYLT